MLRRHCPGRPVIARRIGAVALQRIAVDERPHEHRVGDAANLVLDREQMLTAFEVDDIAKAILILVVLAIDELAKAAMWAS